MRALLLCLTFAALASAEEDPYLTYLKTAPEWTRVPEIRAKRWRTWVYMPWTYRWTIGQVPLGRVANKEKMMPRSFISRDGFSITQPCRRYLEPLIRGEDYPPYYKGLPRYVELRNVAAPRRVGGDFVLR